MQEKMYSFGRLKIGQAEGWRQSHEDNVAVLFYRRNQGDTELERFHQLDARVYGVW